MTPLWIEAEKWHPPEREEVIASDLEGIFLASWNGTQWLDHEDEPLDSAVTHWMHLPPLPEE